MEKQKYIETSGLKISFRHIALLLSFSLISCEISENSAQFGIKIIDVETKRGVPMVELKTLHSVVHYTDNGGFIAFQEPELMNQTLYFEIKSAGYHVPLDKAGRPGISMRVKPGHDTILEITRLNIAERLYRITGSGKNVYEDALSNDIQTVSKSLKAGVLGQDSNLASPYQGKVFWVWGDTFLPDRYEGNFSVAGAWTTDPRIAGWSAEDGIDLNYLTDERGWSRPMIHLDGPGYVWFDFLMALPSDSVGEKLVAKYARVDAYFGNYERGIAVFNDERQIFEKYREVPGWLQQPHTTEHPVRIKMDQEEYYYLTSEFNFSRVKPHLDSISEPGGYEHFTCLLPAEIENTKKIKVERNASGQLIYRWKKNAKTVNYQQQTALIEQGIISKEEALIQTIDLLSGEPIDAGRGSITWNEYRQRWILIAGKQDIWYGEADSPTGPWIYLTRVATHDQYYYNPVHHSFLDQDGGRRIYFEGTFTKFFSKEPPIPRYDYNQLLYGVDLADPHLFLPVPVYRMKSGDSEILGMRPQAFEKSAAIKEIPFFALDRNNETESVVPIFQVTDGSGRLLRSDDGNAELLFYAIDPDFNPDKMFEGVWEFKISSRSFDNTVSLQISNESNGWQVKASKSDFQFTDLQIIRDSIQIDLNHEGSHYHLAGTLLPGRISGSFLNLGTKSSGNWSASKHDETWWAPMSPSVVNLYEIISNDGSYSYSIHPADVQKMERPIIFCKVWINPTSLINFDYGAEYAY